MYLSMLLSNVVFIHVHDGILAYFWRLVRAEEATIITPDNHAPDNHLSRPDNNAPDNHASDVVISPESAP